MRSTNAATHMVVSTGDPRRFDSKNLAPRRDMPGAKQDEARLAVANDNAVVRCHELKQKRPLLGTVEVRRGHAQVAPGGPEELLERAWLVRGCGRRGTMTAHITTGIWGTWAVVLHTSHTIN